MTMFSDIVAHVPQPLQWLLAGVGALCVASRAIGFAQFILGVFVLPGTNLRKYGKPGTWAVVTGASDGLGKEFALQLASKGFNLVLVSRTQSKLDALAEEIKQKNSGKALQVKTFSMDYTRDDEGDYEKLKEVVAGLDIGILVNNVGQSHSIPVSFLDTERKELQNIVTVNCLGTLKTTQTIAPIMQQRKKPGLILTMSSFAGWVPTPYLATYSGSKAFLQHWGSALASELQPHKIDVQVVQSHLVTSAMSKIKRPSMLVPTAKNFVKSALGKVGTGSYQQIAYTYTGWWAHSLMLWVIENTVGAGSPFVIWYNRQMHIDIRKRALRKAEREAKKA